MNSLEKRENIKFYLQRMFQFNSICKQINFCYFYRKHDFYNFINKNIKIQSKFINIKKSQKMNFLQN